MVVSSAEHDPPPHAAPTWPVKQMNSVDEQCESVNEKVAYLQLTVLAMAE